MTDAVPNDVRGPFIAIPIGTPPSHCRSRGQTIYWVLSKTGRRIPVSIKGDNLAAPGAHATGQLNAFGGVDTPEVGKGIAHFADCPQRDTWRSAR